MFISIAGVLNYICITFVQEPEQVPSFIYLKSMNSVFEEFTKTSIERIITPVKQIPQVPLSVHILRFFCWVNKAQYESLLLSSPQKH